MLYRALTLVGVFTLASNLAHADLMWGNQADFGPHHLQEIDTTNGNVTKDFTLSGNGRGVVQVGNVLYVTTADSNVVEQIDATTGADLGAAFSVAGTTGLATMAYDGTNFWIGDYSGTNHAYYYTPTGTLLKTISLADCSGFCDGLEFFNGKLISNEGDNQSPGIYDVYDTDGNLLTHSLISTSGHGSGTGIAFNGTDFFVSDLMSISVYDINGTFIRSFTPNGTNPFGFEDLSFNYSVVLTPEPASTFMVLGGVALIALLRNRSKRSA